MSEPKARCRFIEAWRGYCKAGVKPGHKYCNTHLRVKCSGCGRQAIAECCNAGSVVCGTPYCKACGRHIGCYLR